MVVIDTKMPPASTIMMDYGSGNNRRMINITQLSQQLEETQLGMSEALIAFHAITGCDFTSAFYGKDKAKPLSHLEKNVVTLRL